MDFVQTLLDGLMVGGLYTIVAIGLTLVFGHLGILNFAHSQLIVFGAYIAYLTVSVYHLNFVITIVVAMLLVGMFSLVLERLIFRYTVGDHTTGLVASLGLVLVLQNIIAVVWDPNPKFIDPTFAGTIRIYGLALPAERLFVLGVAVVLVGSFYIFLRHSKWGKSIRAIDQCREAAILMGIRVPRLESSVFVIGGALGAAAGVLYAGLFAISPFMGSGPLMKGFVLTIFGGLGSVPGAIIAGIIVGVTESLGTRYLWPSFQDGYAFIIMMLILFFKPGGLFGSRQKGRV